MKNEILMADTPVYVFDEEAFRKNVKDMTSAFKKYYPCFKIAYSYKTNYAPNICQLAMKLGCYAEVVSPMEYKHASRINHCDSNIVYNGVIRADAEKAVAAVCGAKVNVDNVDELLEIDKCLNVVDRDANIGVRLNFDIGNGLVSRFGIDVEGDDFNRMIEVLKKSKHLNLVGVHCHISKARDLFYWEDRVEKMVDCIDKLMDAEVLNLQYIDLGSNMYGPMEDSLAQQFGDDIPSYEDYARVIGTKLSDEFRWVKPLLIVEAGTPIVANTMGVLSSVVGIKKVRGKTFVTMDCSKFNLGAIAGVKNVPIKVFRQTTVKKNVSDADIVGFTCIEDDVLNRGFTGRLAVGDKILFKNVGAYSNTFAPQFIKPVIGMVTAEGKVVKDGDDYADVFRSYK